MDIKDILVLVGIGIIYLLFSPKKKKTTPPRSAPVFQPKEEEFPPEYYQSTNNNTQKKDNQPNYFTYETIDSFVENQPFMQENVTNVASIDSTDEVEEGAGLNISFEKESFYQGIIFSEILKRPHN